MTVLLLALYLLPAWASLIAGNAAEAGAAALAGAGDAVRFCLELGGSVCLWSAILELLERCGLAVRLAVLLRGTIGRLFPRAFRDDEVRTALTENISANLLGLGNAATPAGIRAARGMVRLGAPCRDELCLLVVLNTASLQLFPAAVGALRQALGSAAPYDILPAVWLTSLASAAAGLLADRILPE
jgi:spore maturation protein A